MHRVSALKIIIIIISPLPAGNLKVVDELQVAAMPSPIVGQMAVVEDGSDSEKGNNDNLLTLEEILSNAQEPSTDDDRKRGSGKWKFGSLVVYI